MSDNTFSAIRARLKYETLSAFKSGYSKFVSTGGMFIPVPEKKLKPVGTVIRFQFLLSDGSTALLGEGTVLQLREPSPSRPKSPVGMLIKFSKLSPESKAVVDSIVAAKEDQKQEQEVRQAMPTPVGQLQGERRGGNEKETKPGLKTAEHPAVTPTDIRSELAPTPVDEVPPSAKRQDDDIAPTEDDIFGDEPSDPVALPSQPLEELSEQERIEPGDDVEPLSADDLFGEESDPAAESGDGFALFTESELTDDSEPEEVAGAAPIEPEEAVTVGAPIAPEFDPEPEPADELEHEAQPQPQEDQALGGVRMFSYDDMSAVEDVGFRFEEESEIDDMFDDLFGAAGDESFFDEVLGLPSEASEQALELEPEEPAPEPEPLSPDVSQDVSLDDVFDSDADDDAVEVLGESPLEPADASDELFAFDEPEPEDDDELEHALQSEDEDEVEHALELDDEDDAALVDDDLILAEDELEEDDEIFADGDAEESDPLELSAPPQPPMFDPELEFGDLQSESSEPDETPEPDLAAAPELATPPTPPPAEPAVELEQESTPEELEPLDDEPEDTVEEEAVPATNPELDNLFEHLNDDEPVESSFELHLQSAEPEREEKREDEEESLEALLALANKEIESKREEESKHKDGEDIFDQLLGDDLPPPPTDEPTFLPTPDLSKKEKKGFISKLFGKD